MATIDRKYIMSCDTVRNLTKEILTLSEKKDCVDAYYDTLTALKVLRDEMDEALGGHTIID